MVYVDARNSAPLAALLRAQRLPRSTKATIAKVGPLYPCNESLDSTANWELNLGGRENLLITWYPSYLSMWLAMNLSLPSRLVCEFS